MSMHELEPMRTAACTTPTSGHGEEVTAWTVDALRSVWERQRNRVNDRIDLIERAIAALAAGRLDADLRGEAVRTAHMLAGSVGMFGFIRASDAAHSLELELAHPALDRVPALSALALRVRDGVRGPVALCSDVPAEEELLSDAHDEPAGRCPHGE